jgi:hypothetical protein
MTKEKRSIVILNYDTEQVDILSLAVIEKDMEKCGYCDLEEYLVSELEYSQDNIHFLVPSKINAKHTDNIKSQVLDNLDFEERLEMSKDDDLY